MARSTLVDVIQDLRDATQAGASEWVLGSTSYFDDDVLQRILDDRRRDVRRHRLVPIIEYQAAGSIAYYEYRSEPQLRHLEQTDGGTALFVVEDAEGNNVGTADWQADYRRGLVTFTADRGGTAYYLTARTYDLHGAAADVLDQWANHEKLSFDVATPEVNIKRSQKYKMLKDAANEHRRKAWVASFEAARGDLC